MIKEFKEDRRRFGTLKACQSLLMWGLHSRLGLDFYLVTLRPLGEESYDLYKPRSDYEIKVIEPETLIEASHDPELDLDEDFVRRAIANQDVITGAFDGKKLVAYTCATSVSAPHDEWFSVQIPKDFRYGYKAFTHPDHRGKRLVYSVAHLRERTQIFLERGSKYHMSFVAMWNLPSLQAVWRTGVNQPIGWVLNFHWRKRPVSLRTPAVRKTGFRFVPATQLGGPAETDNLSG